MSNKTVAQTLSKLIEDGVFNSRLEDLLDMTYRLGPPDSWYRRIKTESGQQEAERLLTELVQQWHYDVYAPSPKDVALGLAALARVKKGTVVDITACKAKRRSSSFYLDHTHHKFVAVNTTVFGTDDQSRQGHIFDPQPYDGLGLQAVILETGIGCRQPQAEVTLVLPPRGTATSAPKKGELVFVRFDIYGEWSASRYTVFDSAGKVVEDTGLALKYILGMVPNRHVRVTEYANNSFTTLLGFPDAETCVATHLPSLGEYFSIMAEKLVAEAELTRRTDRTKSPG